MFNIMRWDYAGVRVLELFYFYFMREFYVLKRKISIILISGSDKLSKLYF